MQHVDFSKIRVFLQPTIMHIHTCTSKCIIHVLSILYYIILAILRINSKKQLVIKCTCAWSTKRFRGGETYSQKQKNRKMVLHLVLMYICTSITDVYLHINTKNMNKWRTLAHQSLTHVYIASIHARKGRHAQLLHTYCKHAPSSPPPHQKFESGVIKDCHTLRQMFKSQVGGWNHVFHIAISPLQKLLESGCHPPIKITWE